MFTVKMNLKVSYKLIYYKCSLPSRKGLIIEIAFIFVHDKSTIGRNKTCVLM